MLQHASTCFNSCLWSLADLSMLISLLQRMLLSPIDYCLFSVQELTNSVKQSVSAVKTVKQSIFSLVTSIPKVQPRPWVTSVGLASLLYFSGLFSADPNDLHISHLKCDRGNRIPICGGSHKPVSYIEAKLSPWLFSPPGESANLPSYNQGYFLNPFSCSATECC